MMEFMRMLFGKGLKDNKVLFKGVLTGILRVAKESLFSGLNNFVSSAGLEPDDFCDKFGFTEPEVMDLLAHRGLNGREMEEVRNWYDGYRYGGTPIYNPWSILNYAFAKEPAFRPHWVNTGGHDLLKRLFFGREADVKAQLSVFMQGESLYAHVDEFLTFRGLETNPDAILSLMYFSGYLRAGATKTVDLLVHRELSIPNREVLLAYRSTLMAWFNEDLSRSFNDTLLHYLTTGDVISFGEGLAKFVLKVASFYDTSETAPSISTTPSCWACWPAWTASTSSAPTARAASAVTTSASSLGQRPKGHRDGNQSGAHAAGGDLAGPLGRSPRAVAQ
jgi:hypothetical protein